jgi:tryptophan-rich sensory protein
LTSAPEWLVGFATLLLFVATALLAWITKVHVDHFKRLVARIEGLYRLQTTARVAHSLLDNAEHRPYISLQNLSQIPVFVSKLTFQLLDSDASSEATIIPEIGATWLRVGETVALRAQPLSDLWRDQHATAVAVECFYSDTYTTQPASLDGKRLRLIWRPDYLTKAFALEKVEV